MMQEPQAGPKILLATLLLGEDLGTWVERQRTVEELTWPQIARKIARLTSDKDGAPAGGVVIGEEWLRVLYRDRERTAS